MADKTCPVCNGSGWIERETVSGIQWTNCLKCGGGGELPRRDRQRSRSRKSDYGKAKR